MSQLSKSTFETTYVDAAGTFQTNTTRDITESDLRQFSDDIADSFINVTDSLLSSEQTHPGGSTTILSSYRSVFYVRKDIATAAVLTGNSSPVTIVSAPSSGYMIVPIALHISLDFNSVSYTTNTTFRFEINGVAVTATNTTLLPGSADRYAMMHCIDIDTLTNLTGQPLVFKVQSGNPAAGNSGLYVGCVYKVVWGLGSEP